jgi:hypothetical protein
MPWLPLILIVLHTRSTVSIFDVEWKEALMKELVDITDILSMDESALFETFSLGDDGVSTVLPDGIHIFKPKIPIWVNFDGPCNGRYCYILRPFGVFYGHLVSGSLWGEQRFVCCALSI